MYRNIERIQEKDIISKLAAKLINSGDVIIIDSSSTTLRLVSYLHNITDLTVITKGAKTAVDLADLKNLAVYSTGGVMRENSLSYIGETVKVSLNNFHAALLFFSCRALSIDNGITDLNEEEAALRKLMMKSCNKSALLCDSTKFDKTSFCIIGDIDCIDYIITDKKPNNYWVQYLKDNNIELICS